MAAFVVQVGVNHEGKDVKGVYLSHDGADRLVTKLFDDEWIDAIYLEQWEGETKRVLEGWNKDWHSGKNRMAWFPLSPATLDRMNRSSVVPSES